MNFEYYLCEQLRLHPSIQPVDIVKLCYQAAYGAEHLLNDIRAAKDYFDKEYAETEARDMALYESISEDVCRVNFSAWKAAGLPGEWLFRMFVASSTIPQGSRELFLCYLEAADHILKDTQVGFTYSDWQVYLEEYKKLGMPSVHHSPGYRECETPTYRIVNAHFLRLLPVLKRAAKWEQSGDVCIIALEGRAASGKSTMAEQLRNILEGEVVHMDDFFLPMELRTEERFDTPGGNVHYERFADEVLLNLKKTEEFAYRIFDCSRMDYYGERRIGNTQFRIVEGSYSMHPSFGDYADISVFSDVEPQEQMNRILHRNGSEMAGMFQERWIPLEESYFREYQIRERADIRI